MFEIYLQPEKYMDAIGSNAMIFVTYKIRDLWEDRQDEDSFKCVIVTSWKTLRIN